MALVSDTTMKWLQRQCKNCKFSFSMHFGNICPDSNDFLKPGNTKFEEREPEPCLGASTCGGCDPSCPSHGV